MLNIFGYYRAHFSHKIQSTVYQKLILILTLLLLVSCAGSETKDSLASEQGDAKELYKKGEKQLQNKNYTLAIEKFETLESRYPFGPYAQQAQLDIAYAYFELQEPDSAIAAADQFIKLNPRHKHVDYAYYVKGLANFSRFDGALDRFIPKDLGDLDTNPIKQAFNDFKRLVTRFPDSPYAADAEQRMIYLRNLLANHEYKVAEFYQRRGAPVAVINRSTHLIKTYDGSDVIPDTLVLMANAYKKLGLQDSLEDTLKVISLNFPGRAPQLTEEIESR